MENKKRLWMILVSVILLLTISFSVPIFLKAASGETPAPGAPRVQNHEQLQPPAGQEESKQFKTMVSFINIGLILSLFVIYAGIYQKIRSSFTLGLMAVIFALGMYAVTSNPLIISLIGGRTGDIGMFQIVPDICTTAALVILVRISIE